MILDLKAGVRLLAATLALLAMCAPASAAVPGRVSLAPNPSFEVGNPANTGPAGWTLSGGQGAWETTGADGHRSVSVIGSGNDENFWIAEGAPLLPGHRYRLRFLARGESAGGTAIAGPATNNRDFGVGSDWTRYTFVFRTPDTGAGPLRFGQWHAAGKVWFDAISLTEVQPFYARRGAQELGAGESVQGAAYQARAPLEGEGSNDARFLESHTAGFNSDRWLMGPGASVTYAHQLAGAHQISASVDVNINYYVSGRLLVEARSAGAWIPVGSATTLGGHHFDLPAALFPASRIQVRLQAEASENGRAPEFQVDSYRYHATLNRPLPSLEGATHYAEVETRPAEGISVVDWGSLKPGAGAAALLRVGQQPVVIRWTIESPAGAVMGRGFRSIPSGHSSRIIRVPYALIHAGRSYLRLTVDSATPHSQPQRLLSEAVLFDVAALDAADYGYPAVDLAHNGPGGAIWWAEAEWKIGRLRPAPAGPPTEVRLSAAGGDEEPVQIVLRPDHTLAGVTVQISPLEGPDGHTLLASAWRLFHVARVPVAQPSDPSGAAGEWPDPLPPYTGPFTAVGGENHVLWLSVRVPEGTAGGDYRGHVEIQAGTRRWSVPLRLHVWNFSLPRTPHLRSAMGIYPDSLRRYHNLKTDTQLRQVWDLYMQNFAAHRLCPTNSLALDPIVVKIVGDGAAKRVILDAASFDRAAHRYLDELGFTAFSLPVEGMGGGTFYERKEGEFGGYRAGTPGYNALWGDYVRQLEAHLKEKGWLSKAYVYWFDEPAERDFPFVQAGMERLKKYAPGLDRLLTKEPEPGIIGSVNLWCPILNAYNETAAHLRQAAGEEVWWYICTGPKAPYPGEFIDRPGTDLPVWVWETWRHGVQGLLIWETTYWNSPAAYPNGLQDPWSDPMSWVEGYGTPTGTRQPWGNGDGRFLYPPEAAVRASGEPILTGPINSIRWELLRDGLEDYEYFWLLRDRITRARQRGVAETKLKAAEDLLTIPAAVSRGLTDYNPDPRPMLVHRERLARAIEGLMGAGS